MLYRHRGTVQGNPMNCRWSHWIEFTLPLCWGQVYNGNRGPSILHLDNGDGFELTRAKPCFEPTRYAELSCRGQPMNGDFSGDSLPLKFQTSPFQQPVQINPLSPFPSQLQVGVGLSLRNEYPHSIHLTKITSET